jgi:hypothetical protein
MRRISLSTLILGSLVLGASACAGSDITSPDAGAQEAPVVQDQRRDRCDAFGVAGPQRVPDPRGCEIDDAGSEPAEF